MTPGELTTWRERHGLLQEQLAAMLGVHVQTVSKWEREVQKIPPYLKLALNSLDQSLNPPVDKSKPKKKGAK